MEEKASYPRNGPGDFPRAGPVVRLEGGRSQPGVPDVEKGGRASASSAKPARSRPTLALKLWRIGRGLGGIGWIAFRFSLSRLWQKVTRRDSPLDKAIWFQEMMRAALKSFRVEASFQGEPPAEGLLVCNHLSYLDILVLGSRQPMIFVSKSDVRAWPVIGFMAGLGGTIFVERERRGAVADPIGAIRQALEAGIVVALFPEGTSSAGDEVLPFRSALLEPAVQSGCRVTPAYIRYDLPDGVAGEEVCYWGEMVFLPHLSNLMAKELIRASVVYGKPGRSALDRKEMARTLHQEVSALAGERGSVIRSSFPPGTNLQLDHDGSIEN